MFQHAIHAVLSNDFTLSSAVVAEAASALRAAPEDGATAWGFGSVQDRRALVKRRPHLGNHVFDFAALLGDAPSRVQIGVVAGPTERALGTDAIPPFRFHHWLMAGFPLPAVAMTPSERAAVRALVPDHVLRTQEGESDGELLALALVGGVAMDPASANADFPLDRLATHLARSLGQVRALAPELPLDSVVSNGRLLVATADQRPFYWRVFEGLDDDPVEASRRRMMHLSPRPLPRPHFRAVFVSSTPDLPGAWLTLEQGQQLRYSTARGAMVAPVSS